MKNWRINFAYNIFIFIFMFIFPIFVIKVLFKLDITSYGYIKFFLVELVIFTLTYILFELKVRTYYSSIMEKAKRGNEEFEIENKYSKKTTIMDTLISFEYFFNEELDKIFARLEQERVRINSLEKENYTKFHVKSYQLKSVVQELERMNDSLMQKEEVLDHFIEMIERTDNINTTYDMFFDDMLFQLEKIFGIKDSIIIRKKDGEYKVYSKISNEFILDGFKEEKLETLKNKVYYDDEINKLTGYNLVLKLCSNKKDHGYLLINDFKNQYMGYPVFMKIVNTISSELGNIADNLYYIENLKNKKNTSDEKVKELNNELLKYQRDMEVQLMQMTDMYEEIVILYEAGKTLGRLLDIKKIEQLALEMIVDIVGGEFGLIYYYYPKKEHPILARIVYANENDENVLKDLKILARTTRIFKDLKEKSNEFIINDIENSEYKNMIPEDMKGKFRNFIQVPIYYGNDISGGVAVFNKKDYFTAANKSLITALTNQLGLAVQNIEFLNREIERKKEESMLKIASEIQNSLFPQEMPIVDNFEMYGINISAKEVGGDYYDLIKIDENTVIGVIADVSGKGIPAALLVSMFRTIFRMLVEHFKEYSTDRILYYLNNIIEKENMEGKFITAICFKLNAKSKSFEFANAGHDPVMVYRSKDEKIEEYDLDGTILGFMEDEVFEKKEIKIETGDSILLYTDGVVEARNQDEFFEFERLKNIIEENNKYPADYIVRKIHKEVYKFLGESAQNDDITIISIKGV